MKTKPTDKRFYGRVGDRITWNRPTRRGVVWTVHEVFPSRMHVILRADGYDDAVCNDPTELIYYLQGT